VEQDDVGQEEEADESEQPLHHLPPRAAVLSELPSPPSRLRDDVPHFLFVEQVVQQTGPCLVLNLVVVQVPEGWIDESLELLLRNQEFRQLDGLHLGFFVQGLQLLDNVAAHVEVLARLVLDCGVRGLDIGVVLLSRQRARLALNLILQEV